MSFSAVQFSTCCLHRRELLKISLILISWSHFHGVSHSLDVVLVTCNQCSSTFEEGLNSVEVIAALIVVVNFSE